jgi:hypothetical protein
VKPGIVGIVGAAGACVLVSSVGAGVGAAVSSLAGGVVAGSGVVVGVVVGVGVVVVGVVAVGVVAAGVAAAPGMSASGFAPTPASLTTSELVDDGSVAVGDVSAGGVGSAICCGVPIASSTTGASAIALVSALTTADAANTPCGVPVVGGCVGVNWYVSRATGTRRVAFRGAVGAWYGATFGSFGAA